MRELQRKGSQMLDKTALAHYRRLRNTRYIDANRERAYKWRKFDVCIAWVPALVALNTARKLSQPDGQITELLIHNKCGLPVELCICADARLVYDWDDDVFIDTQQ
jgi:hypothetical protein